MPISKTNVSRMFAKVKENRERLEACTGHRFPGGRPKLGERQTCQVCQGTMSLSSIHDYMQGWKHAGRDVNEVWPNADVPALPKPVRL